MQMILWFHNSRKRVMRCANPIMAGAWGMCQAALCLLMAAGAIQTPKPAVLTMLWGLGCNWSGSRWVLWLAGEWTDKHGQTDPGMTVGACFRLDSFHSFIAPLLHNVSSHTWEWLLFHTWMYCTSVFLDAFFSLPEVWKFLLPFLCPPCLVDVSECARDYLQGLG